jgi:hypothetical protein
MALTAPPSKLPWNNRFRMPTDAELLSAFQAPTLGYLKHARERFKAGPSMLEMICWHGTWKWTFAYRSIALMQCQWAYILPDPAKAQICVPVLEASLADLPAKKVSKAMRELIVKSPLIDGTYWVTWDLTSKAVVDEACTLAAARMGEMAGVR